MQNIPARKPLIVAVVALLGLAACSSPPPGSGGIHDPFEAQNRKTHAFNKGLDRALVRPLAKGYSAALPNDIENMVGTFADTTGLPGMVVNDILQFRLDDALYNSVRFVTNVVLGFGGVVDAAAEFGLHPRDTDFGETLHVWGVREGAYVELPVLGPSTERDAVGTAVDFFTNPLGYVLPTRQSRIVTAAKVVSKVGDRGRFADTVDSILYDSADSYAQARLIYLQNRRYELGGGPGEDQADIYEDPYEDPYADPYAE
jgi:phospholipid-binding lipoprotein MlaA